MVTELFSSDNRSSCHRRLLSSSFSLYNRHGAIFQAQCRSMPSAPRCHSRPSPSPKQQTEYIVSLPLHLIGRTKPPDCQVESPQEQRTHTQGLVDKTRPEQGWSVIELATREAQSTHLWAPPKITTNPAQRPPAIRYLMKYASISSSHVTSVLNPEQSANCPLVGADHHAGNKTREAQPAHLWEGPTCAKDPLVGVGRKNTTDPAGRSRKPAKRTHLLCR